MAQRGWESCHAHYPDRALGPPGLPARAPSRRAARSSPASVRPPPRACSPPGAAPRSTTRGAYPVWNDSARADYRPTPGLWALEPHIGRDGVGVKFEELLVVTEDDAYWLDDHLLHTQRWAAAGYSITPLAAA